MHRLELAEGRVILDLVFGDALETLPGLKLETAYPVDAFFLDDLVPAAELRWDEGEPALSASRTRSSFAVRATFRWVARRRRTAYLAAVIGE